MIVKDEEATVAKCIESVQSACDHIIVVDTGSTDNTLRILSNFPQVEVRQIKWENDFSQARNFSTKDVKTDLILVLDADEYLLPKDVEALKELKNSEHIPDCFRVGLVTKDLEGKTCYLNFHQRLYRSLPHLKWQYKVHENLDLRTITKIETAPFIIQHLKTADTLKTSGQRNLHILKDLISSSHDRDSCEHYSVSYASDLWLSGEKEKSMKRLKEFIQADMDVDKKRATLLLCWFYFEDKKFQDIINLLSDKDFGGDGEFLKAKILAEMAEYAQAELCLKLILEETPEGTDRFKLLPHFLWSAKVLYGKLLIKQGKVDQGMGILEELHQQLINHSHLKIQAFPFSI